MNADKQKHPHIYFDTRIDNFILHRIYFNVSEMDHGTADSCFPCNVSHS